MSGDLDAEQCRQKASHYRERAMALPYGDAQRREFLTCAFEYDQLAAALEAVFGPGGRAPG